MLRRRLLLYCIAVSIVVESANGQPRLVDLQPLDDIASLLRAVNGTNLPRWEDHVIGLPPCATDVPVESGSWYLSDNRHIVFEPADCYLPRFSARDARRCLANKHIAFIGDSLTRYQYLSLAYFLSKLQHLGQFGMNKAEPSIVIEREFPSWDSFYTESNAALENSRDGCATEQCECGEYATWRKETRTFDLRYPYPCQALHHADKQNRSTLSYFEIYAPWFTRDSTTFPELAQTALSHYSSAIHTVKPTHVVWNQGIWMLDNLAAADHVAVLEDVMSSLTRSELASAKLMWKTTTTTAEGLQIMYKEEKLLALAKGLQILDASSITMAAFRQGLIIHWDRFHFIPLVYQAINDLLLHQLCSASQ